MTTWPITNRTETIIRATLVTALTGLLCLALVAPPARAAEVVDEIGRRISIPDRPERIIALSPSLTEILFALGLGEKVVGVTRWSDMPAEACRLPKVGAYISPNLEMIASLTPDLVLANREGNPPWVVDKLSRAGIAVFVTRPDTPLALPASIRRLGAVCGAPDAGERLAAKLETEFAGVQRAVAGTAPVHCLLLVGSKPVVAAGEKSFHGRLLGLAGGDNAAAGVTVTWPRLSMEYVVETRPELIIISTMERGSNARKIIEYWRSVPGLGVGEGCRIETVPSDLLDRPGPRLGAGLKALARAIHPELFKGRKAVDR